MKYYRNGFSLRIPILLILTLLSTAVFPWGSGVSAETGYVSDMLILSVREGPGRQYNILSTIRSNAAVEILEKEENYFKVKIESGEVGWVERRYISPELPKTMIIDRLERKIESLEQEKTALNEARAEIQDNNETLTTRNDQLEEQNSTLSEQNSSLTQKISDLMNQLEGEAEDGSADESVGLNQRIMALEGKLNEALQDKEKAEEDLKRIETQYQALVENSGNVAELMEENEALKKELDTASKGLSKGLMEIFMTDGQDVLKTAMIKWFLSGAGVLILGWLIGRSFTGGSKRKRGMLG